jgi:hypothetical protein
LRLRAKRDDVSGACKPASLQLARKLGDHVEPHRLCGVVERTGESHLASLATITATRIASSVLTGPEAETPRRLSSPLSRRLGDDRRLLALTY